MTCKPTVGEVRRVFGGAHIRVNVVGNPASGDARRAPYWSASSIGRVYWPDEERCPIVEVAPENRARVTAGPAWLGEGR